MISKIKSEVRTLWHLMRKRLHVSAKDEKSIVDGFHKLYYESIHFGKTWSSTQWMGHKIMKCPLDMWVYQEILYELKPDLIIETGTYHGASAYFLASMCDLLGNGEIITIDIESRPGRPVHPRIEYVTGSSTSAPVLDLVHERIKGKKRVMVILDSDHSMKHVREELGLYSPFVTAGSYLIVEDGNVNGRPVDPEHGPGPSEAMEDFLKDSKEFRPDPSREKFLLTFNPGGYLKRVALPTGSPPAKSAELASSQP